MPQQRNGVDCGLFVYNFARELLAMFVQDPSLTQQVFGSRWFDPKEAEAMRKKLFLSFLDIFLSDPSNQDKWPDVFTRAQTRRAELAGVFSEGEATAELERMAVATVRFIPSLSHPCVSPSLPPSFPPSPLHLPLLSLHLYLSVSLRVS